MNEIQITNFMCISGNMHKKRLTQRKISQVYSTIIGNDISTIMHAELVMIDLNY